MDRPILSAQELMARAKAGKSPWKGVRMKDALHGWPESKWEPHHFEWDEEAKQIQESRGARVNGAN